MVKELNINIISPIAELFEKQLSLDWESRGVRFFFNSKEERLWDAIVVYLKSATIIQYTIKGRFMSR